MFLSPPRGQVGTNYLEAVNYLRKDLGKGRFLYVLSNAYKQLPADVKNPLKPELIAPEFEAKDIGTMTRQINRLKKNAKTPPKVLKYIDDVQAMLKAHGDEAGEFFQTNPRYLEELQEIKDECWEVLGESLMPLPEIHRVDPIDGRERSWPLTAGKG
jgi:hypothetical protein